MEQTLALDLSHATETAAMAAARASGKGDKKGADGEAVSAMRQFFNIVDFRGEVVIGEGRRDEAPMLFVGEKLGTGKGMAVDIAVDPLENTNATANLNVNAIAVLAASEKGGLMAAPDSYANKLVVGPSAKGKVDIRWSVAKNLAAVAKSLDRKVEDLVVVILDRERHESLISEVRDAGARAKLISDGDLMPCIAVCARGTGVHMVIGSGGAPEGVIAAVAVKILGGEMQVMFWAKDSQEEAMLKKAGVAKDTVFNGDDLAPGKNLIFCATGVTDGEVLKGVRFFGGGARTHSLVITSQSNKIRFMDTTHIFDKSKINYRL